MKGPLKLIIGCASLGFLASTALAQGTSTYGQPGSSSGTATTDPSVTAPSSSTLPGQATAPQTSQEFFHAKNFIGLNVKDSQGKSAGEIKDLLFSPQTGEVFAAFDASNSRYFLVPWPALTITRTERNKEQAMLNVTKQELESGPTVPRNQWQQLANPTFTQSIYAHYNLQAPPAPMGGASSRSLGGTSSGTSTSSGSDTSSSTQGKELKKDQ